MTRRIVDFKQTNKQNTTTSKQTNKEQQQQKTEPREAGVGWGGGGVDKEGQGMNGKQGQEKLGHSKLSLYHDLAIKYWTVCHFAPPAKPQQASLCKNQTSFHTASL